MVPIAVIDTETTGVFPHRHDRVIELAAVVVRPDGEVLREFATLVNPGRDIGRTDIHGITSEDLLHAPTFADVAGALAEALDGCVAVAGHNVRFDRGFVAREFERIGHPLPDTPSLCTMELAGGGRLADCCETYGVPFDGPAHAALHDARATARLLTCLLSEVDVLDDVRSLPPVAWPQVPKSGVPLLTRDESRRRQAAPPTYLERLLARTHATYDEADDSTALAYSALLDRVLEDRRVDDGEGDALVEVAERWGIGPEHVRRIHAGYLRRLTFVALADGVVTDVERRDLALVARLLGVGQPGLEEMLAEASEKMAEVRSVCRSGPAGGADAAELVGKRVCFTGECGCRFLGRDITRELAAELAGRKGLVVCPSVTKKLDLLVVADPHTQSGKAKKARDYGVRVVHEPVFWKMLGVEVE